MGKFFVSMMSIILFSSIAEGAVLIDTGAPFGAGGISICGPLSNASYCNQSVALKVNISEPTNITDIQSYFGRSTIATDLTIALYNSNSNVPSQQLYQSVLTVEGFGWDGLSNIDWAVDAGDYWVAFEVRTGQDFFGYLTNGAPIKLETAFSSNFGSTWQNIGTDYTGALILQGTPIVAVPEPEFYAMILAGLCIVGFASRRLILMD